MSAPYFQNGFVSLYHGDCRNVLPTLDVVIDSCVTDPPYGETSAVWDSWPMGWVSTVSSVLPASASLWCFGSARMFLDHVQDFADWKFAQEALWLKRNGSGPTHRDRLVKIHEWAYHWYRGKWGDLHHEWERDLYDGPDKSARSVGNVGHQNIHKPYAYVDDGTRQPRSVTYLIESPSVRYRKRHRTEKPFPVVLPLVRECTPPGGLVLDCFAGTGTTGVAAVLSGHRALLIEGDESMCEIAATRLDGDLETEFGRLLRVPVRRPGTSESRLQKLGNITRRDSP